MLKKIHQVSTDSKRNYGNLFNNNKIYIVFLLLLFFTENLKAQFTVDVQLRNRFELRDGYQKLALEGSTPAAFMTQRTRIGFGYNSENIKIKITPQDVRVWGDDVNMGLGGSNGNDASLDLYEGFAEIKISESGWLKIGRQEWVYDNQSILSNANWNQNGISNDAIVLKLKSEKWNLHLGSSWYALNQASGNNLYPTNRYKSINFIWINRQFNNNFKVSFIHLAAGRTKTDSTNSINFRQTTGFFAEYKLNNLLFVGNAYYQYGKNQSGKNISAYLADFEANYKIGNFTSGVGLSYISGNSKTGIGQTTDNLYDPIFRSRHTFNGYIDYFTSYPAHTKNGGLIDIYALLNYKFTSSLSISNNLHFFQLAQTNLTTPTDKVLGFENDLVLKYKFSDWGSFESGYSFFLPSETLKIIQGVADAKFSQFFYLQLTVTPTLFKS
jgi:hypothetical protein